MEQLIIDVRSAGLVVAGELDQFTAPLMVEALEAFLGRRVQVDMAGVSFIDSSGLSALLRVMTNGTDILIVEPSSAVRRLLELTGLLGQFGLN